MQKQIEKIISKTELLVIKTLSTPNKVQDFLDTLPFNFEEKEETYMSPRVMLRERRAHCFEGAIFASLCLTYHHIENYLIDLKTKNIKKDSDHIVCVFKINNYWGAISKTNHSVLRWRDPIYKDFKELAKTYFHEYFLDTGEKDLESFSRPFDIRKKFGTKWIINEENLDEIAEALDNSPHLDFVSKGNQKFIRKACNTEIKGAAIMEWNKNGKML